jgi:uncharacterized membrane protein YkvI
MTSWFRRYLLPGFIFQSIMIAGGYGTGRELVEFFLQYGPVEGLLGMLLPATVLMSLTCIVAFELSRVTRCYDYRSFLQQLLGRAWVLYELGYITTVVLILAVIGAATGTLLSETFSVSGNVGTVALMVVIAFLTFKGTEVIEGLLSIWSFVLYGVYLIVFVMSIIKFGDVIENNLTVSSSNSGWVLSGIRYGALQVSLVPAILFATTHITRRRESVIAGALTGPIAMIPGVLFYVAMLAHFPAIIDRPIPANYLLELLESKTLQVVFQIVLIGTFIETGTGLVHALNERICSSLSALKKSMPNYLRPLTAVLLLLLASVLSRFGLIDLIAIGYGTLAWGFIAVFTIPLLTIGVWKIIDSK